MQLIGGFSWRWSRVVAAQPAGSVLDWTIDASDDMAETGDSLVSAEWTLPAGLTGGPVVNTSARTTLFITAPPAPSPRPYRVGVRYATAVGRSETLAFDMYVTDPVRWLC